MSLSCYTEEQKTLELCMNAFIEYPNELQFIPEKFKTQEFFKMVINKSPCDKIGCLLFYVPEKFRNKELSMLAVELCPSIISSVPPKYYCDELYLLLIQRKIDRLRNISKNVYKYESDGNTPDIYLHDELCAIGRKFNAGSDDVEAEEDKKRYERGLMLLYIACCKHNGMALYYVNPSYLSQELCITACCNSGMALQYVPLPLRTRALCKIAIEQAPEAKRFIPEDIYVGMFPIALANAPIAPMKTSQHKSKQKKKIIIIKRPIVINYAPKNKYKKIINAEKTQPELLRDNLKKELYLSTPGYRRTILSYENGIVFSGKGAELKHSLSMGHDLISKIKWCVLYKEISKIMDLISIINKYIILITIHVIEGGTVYCNILDNCGNYFYSHIQNDILTMPHDHIHMNGSTIPIRDLHIIIKYDVPILDMLVDKLKTVYYQEDSVIIPICSTYNGDTSNNWCSKAIVAINSELIRANKTKRKLDASRTECALLRLELLEAKNRLICN